jgi:predicted nucleic acid-binding protein
MIVLDTNVVSEPGRPQPSVEVMRWYARHASELYVTTITQAEMHYGFVRLPAGKKKAALIEQARQIFSVDFAGRVLSFDGAAAEAFAEIAAARRNAGLEIKIFDSQIAAIARAHGASVATRDLDDFRHAGIPLVNPWTA